MIFVFINKRAIELAPALRWGTRFSCVAALFFAITGAAMAASYDGAMGNTNYVAMTGDVNNDGYNDVLMKAVPKIVMIPIDDDLDVPIPIPPPSPTFILLSTGDGGYSVLTNPSLEMIRWPGWEAASQEITYAGPSGVIAGSVTITAARPEQASFVVSMAADTGLLQITSITAPAVGPSSGPTGSSVFTETYSYDALGRLRMLSNSSGDLMTYAYDLAGNRTSTSVTKSGAPPPVEGVFTYGSNGGHSSNGTSGDLITFTVKNTGAGTIASASATCSGGSFVNNGNFSSPTLAPGATGTIQCRAAASGSYSAAKVTMRGTGAANNGVLFGPY